MGNFIMAVEHFTMTIGEYGYKPLSCAHEKYTCRCLRHTHFNCHCIYFHSEICSVFIGHQLGAFASAWLSGMQVTQPDVMAILGKPRERSRMKIREIRESEYLILSDFLYEAIFVPEGMKKPLKTIILQPDLQVYIADFGKADDWCLVAETEEKIVGAVWARIMNDYGHIDNETPSLAISLYKEYRHSGIGTALM